MGPRGFRRRGRRRGLIVGAAVGASVARHNSAAAQEEQQAVEPEPQSQQLSYEQELVELQKMRAQNLITDEEYEAKRKQVLGL